MDLLKVEQLDCSMGWSLVVTRVPQLVSWKVESLVEQLDAERAETLAVSKDFWSGFLMAVS